MIITRHGDYFLKFVFADKIIGLNPISKDSKLKTTKFGSDVVLSNVFHKDFNGFDFMSFGDREPFIIKGPGEYEIADVFIKAFGFVSKFDGEDRVVTSYTMLLDGINVGIFGPITSGDQFSNDAFEEFSKSDVFILPIGGGDTFSPKDAWKFVKQFGPKIIIPVCGTKEDLEEFKSEAGVDLILEDKLTLKQKDISEEGKLQVIDLKIAK